MKPKELSNAVVPPHVPSVRRTLDNDFRIEESSRTKQPQARVLGLKRRVRAHLVRGEKSVGREETGR